MLMWGWADEISIVVSAFSLHIVCLWHLHILTDFRERAKYCFEGTVSEERTH